MTPLAPLIAVVLLLQAVPLIWPATWPFVLGLLAGWAACTAAFVWMFRSEK
jgi:hypothetical protein